MKSNFLIVFLISIVLCSDTEHFRDSESESNYESAEDILCDKQLVTDLFSAILNGNVSEVQSLIDRGVPLNPGRDPKPTTIDIYPLHSSIAVTRRHGRFNEKIFRLLIKNGANVETIDYEGKTPLYSAVNSGNVAAVKILLENDANPNTYYVNEQLHYNRSALQVAFLLSYFNEQIIDLLIEHGADINQTDSKGRTPLHLAIIGGFKKAIELLTEKGTNINAVDKWKMTPLHYIAQHDSKTIAHQHWTDDDSLKFAELLIDHGADAYAKAADDDKTPLDMAKSKTMRKFLGSKMGYWAWLKTRW